MTIGSRQNLSKGKTMDLYIDNEAIKHKPSIKLIGVHIDETLTWDDHIKHVFSKVANGLRMLYKTRTLTNDQETLKSVYNSLVQPYFDYCNIVWGDCSKTRVDQLQRLQNRAARIITRADFSLRSRDLLINMEWPNLSERQKLHLKIMMFKVFHKCSPLYLQNLFYMTSEIHSYNLRGTRFDLQLPKPKTNFLKRSFSYRGAKTWNDLSNDTRELSSLSTFKNAIL